MIGAKPGRAATVEVEMDAFCGALQAHDLQALWKISRGLMPAVPAPKTQSWLWRWSEILPLAREAGRLITIARGGDRRVLAFANPGLAGAPFTSTTLWGAVQYLGPGETAPAHRHTPSAIRFVLTGSGAYTTVNGDACDMEAGDLILTPSWSWHDHNNSGTEPMVWFDGLDLPLATTLDAIFFENHPLDRQPVDGRNLSEASGHSPLLRYKRADTDSALEKIHRRDGGFLASLEYTDPVTGAPAVPTFASEMQRVYPGGRTPARRKVGSSVYIVFKGRGRTVINGERFDWSTGDTFVTPSWAVVDHEADEPSDLFAVSDHPVLRALGLYREEILGAVQPVTSTFDPARRGAQQTTAVRTAR